MVPSNISQYMNGGGDAPPEGQRLVHGVPEAAMQYPRQVSHVRVETLVLYSIKKLKRYHDYFGVFSARQQHNLNIYLVLCFKFTNTFLQLSTGSVLGNVPSPGYLPGGSHREGASGGNQPLCRAVHEEFRLHQGTVWPTLNPPPPPHRANSTRLLHIIHRSSSAQTLKTSIDFGCTVQMWFFTLEAPGCLRLVACWIILSAVKSPIVHFCFCTRWRRRSWRMPSWHVAG